MASDAERLDRLEAVLRMLIARLPMDVISRNTCDEALSMLEPTKEQPRVRRMAANEDMHVHSAHRVEHNWVPGCEVLPRCTPLPEPAPTVKDHLTVQPAATDIGWMPSPDGYHDLYIDGGFAGRVSKIGCRGSWGCFDPGATDPFALHQTLEESKATMVARDSQPASTVDEIAEEIGRVALRAFMNGQGVRNLHPDWCVEVGRAVMDRFPNVDWRKGKSR